jgi:mycofactocin glycosyltransferase
MTSRTAAGVSGTPAAAAAAGTAIQPLPRGFGIELDSGTRQLSDGTLFGGSPARALRLTAAGQRAMAELRQGPVRSAAAGVLARRLTDAGLAHPAPPPDRAWRDVTVIIPVRDRTTLLERCLAAAGAEHQVVVVDDGSADPAAVAAIAARHGAEVRRLQSGGGPAAARNAGLFGIDTELIAFLDSDCAPPPSWISELAVHLADPLVAAVAPRIVESPAAGSGAAARYATACGSLDLGERAARVRPGSRVGYVPTAALLVRRAALEAAAVDRDGQVFDPALRYGEDVDLIWRLHAAGWRIRYEPSVLIAHDSPASWPGLLARRYRYGTSAAPLARRHPANLAPLVLQPWPAVTVAALLARKPVAATAALAGGWLNLTAMIRRAGIPADGAIGAALTAARQTWLGAGRYATQFAAPALAIALAAPGGHSGARRWGRRAAAASLLLGPALTSYAERKPELGPVTFSLARIADDVCYGAGVWAGCLRERTVVPLRPAISWRQLSISRPTGNGKG